MKKLTPGTDIRELMLDVARGRRAMRLEPTAKRLSVLVLTNKHDVRVREGDSLGAIGVLFLTEATDAQFHETFSSGGTPTVSGYILSIGGVVLAEEIEVDRNDLVALSIGQRRVLRGPKPKNFEACGDILLKFFQAADDDYLSEVAAVINARRWTSGVWIERDRAQIGLTDELTGKGVFSLWDEDFYQALEDGLLSAPRLPNPSDSEWHRPALDYAESCGLMSDLELRPKASDHSMPIAAPASRSVDRPHG